MERKKGKDREKMRRERGRDRERDLKKYKVYDRYGKAYRDKESIERVDGWR